MRLAFDLVSNHATDDSTTDCSNGTATGKHCARNTAYGSSNGGVFLLRRHVCATRQSHDRDRGKQDFFVSIHEFISIVKGPSKDFQWLAAIG